MLSSTALLFGIHLGLPGFFGPRLALGGDFNFDFNVSFTEEQQGEGVVEYNYRRGGHAMDVTPVPEPVAKFAAMSGTDAAAYARERPGMSAFALKPPPSLSH